MHGKILVLACGALAKEILDIFETNKLDHLELHCLPANLHLFPEKITSAVREAVIKYRPQYQDIFVAYADCGTGGQLKTACNEMGIQMIEGPHCYSFFDGNFAFEQRQEDELTAFYLTDFLVRQFDAFVWKPMGFDKHPELISMMFGNYEKLIYLAQSQDPELDKKAEESAQKLGLTYERRMTGYGDLETTLKAIKPISKIN